MSSDVSTDGVDPESATSQAISGANDVMVAEVVAAAHAYERALVDGDGPGAAAFFAEDGDISRFGPEGAQFGREAVVALRTSYPQVAAPAWVDEQARVLAPGVVVHLAVLQRGDTVVQRTQLWKHDGTSWRIHHAHVSRLAAPRGIS